MILTYSRNGRFDDLSGQVDQVYLAQGSSSSSSGGGTPGPGGIGEFGLRRAANVAVIGK